MEFVSYRLRVRVEVPKYQPQPAAAGASAAPPREAAKGTRAVHFSAGPAAKTVILERDRLPVGCVFAGPAIVEQFDATTAVPPGWGAQVDTFRNLVLRREERP